MERMEKIKTRLKPTDYFYNEVVSIKNPKQYLLYIKNGVYPIDIYTSIDEETNNSILVMIFLKKDTTDVFRRWMNYELE
jgi:hypothetical protein